MRKKWMMKKLTSIKKTLHQTRKLEQLVLL
jgi:hypothetical protein